MQDIRSVGQQARIHRSAAYLARFFLSGPPWCSRCHLPVRAQVYEVDSLTDEAWDGTEYLCVICRLGAR